MPLKSIHNPLVYCFIPNVDALSALIQMITETTVISPLCTGVEDPLRWHHGTNATHTSHTHASPTATTTRQSREACPCPSNKLALGSSLNSTFCPITTSIALGTLHCRRSLGLYFSVSQFLLLSYVLFASTLFCLVIPSLAPLETRDNGPPLHLRA